MTDPTAQYDVLIGGGGNAALCAAITARRAGATVLILESATKDFRGGNSLDDLVCVVLLRDGAPMRFFPIGAKSEVHVPLRVVEDLAAGTVLELHASAPDGASGTLVVDLGLVEV